MTTNVPTRSRPTRFQDLAFPGTVFGREDYFWPSGQAALCTVWGFPIECEQGRGECLLLACRPCKRRRLSQWVQAPTRQTGSSRKQSEQSMEGNEVAEGLRLACHKIGDSASVQARNASER